MTATTRADDERLLRILDLHVVEGLTAREIAARLRMSRGSVCGMMHRVQESDVAQETKGLRGAGARDLVRDRIGVDYGRGAAVRSADWHWARFATVRT